MKMKFFQLMPVLFASKISNEAEVVHETCSNWIRSASICNPPKRKIDNYIHRFRKVLLDAVWHVENAKRCTADGSPSSGYKNTRSRRNEEDEDYFAFFDEHDPFADYENYEDYEYEGGKLDEQGPEIESSSYEPIRLSGGAEVRKKWWKNKSKKERCKNAINQFYTNKTFTKCGKHGSWVRRADGLLRTVSTMEQICKSTGNSGYGTG